MPIYEYFCECGHEWENVHTMDDRHNEKCPLCSKQGKIKISLSSPKVFHMVLHDLDPEKPIEVNSRAELKAECKQRGVEFDTLQKPKKKKRMVFTCH